MAYLLKRPRMGPPLGLAATQRRTASGFSALSVSANSVSRLKKRMKGLKEEGPPWSDSAVVHVVFACGVRATWATRLKNRLQVSRRVLAGKRKKTRPARDDREAESIFSCSLPFTVTAMKTTSMDSGSKPLPYISQSSGFKPQRSWPKTTRTPGHIPMVLIPPAGIRPNYAQYGARL